MEAEGFRVDLDESSERLNYKIRHWKTQKVPYILVVGKNEAADGTVSPNERGVDEKRPAVLVAEFARELRDRIARKT